MVNNCGQFIPIGSMYGIFTYIWVIFVVNVGKYSIHGSYGIGKSSNELHVRPPFGTPSEEFPYLGPKGWCLMQKKPSKMHDVGVPPLMEAPVVGPSPASRSRPWTQPGSWSATRASCRRWPVATPRPWRPCWVGALEDAGDAGEHRKCFGDFSTKHGDTMVTQRWFFNIFYGWYDEERMVIRWWYSWWRNGDNMLIWWLWWWYNGDI